VLGPVVKGRKGEYRSLIDDVRKSGFVRVRVDGSLYEIGEQIRWTRTRSTDVQVVVDRHRRRSRAADKAGRVRSRRRRAGWRLGDHRACARCGDPDVADFACPYDGTSVPEPEPRNFSFNSPHGACPTCTGIGFQLVVDGDLVVPDPSLSLSEGAIAAWSRSQFFYPELLESVSKYFGIDMDKPWTKLSKQHRDALLNGNGRPQIRFGYKNQYGHARMV